MKNRFTTFADSISAPEKFLLLVLLIFGSIACLTIPLSAGYDEETHIVRAWQMAHLYFVPNEQLGTRLPFPALYWELSYRRQPIVEAVAPGLWSKYGSLRLDAHDYVYASVETRSVYSPLLLLPQALTLRYLGLSLQLPALAVYYACRFAGLAFLFNIVLARTAQHPLWQMAARHPDALSHGPLPGRHHQHRHHLQWHRLSLPGRLARLRFPAGYFLEIMVDSSSP